MVGLANHSGVAFVRYSWVNYKCYTESINKVVNYCKGNEKLFKGKIK